MEIDLSLSSVNKQGYILYRKINISNFKFNVIMAPIEDFYLQYSISWK